MKMINLLVASSNTHKVSEIAKYFDSLPYNIIGLKDMKINVNIDEKYSSYKENAVLKAKTYGEIGKILTLADDSGLEVEALQKRPGVYSARYAKGSDIDRYQKILKEMNLISEEKRNAQYQCVIAIYNPTTKKCRTFSGIVKGKITNSPVGTNGFGYDPIFYYPKVKKTFAQMTMEDKEKYSHRGKALIKVREYLAKLKV
jgi:XTP/dITP diphosphohydrolase